MLFQGQELFNGFVQLTGLQEYASAHLFLPLLLLYLGQRFRFRQKGIYLRSKVLFHFFDFAVRHGDERDVRMVRVKKERESKNGYENLVFLRWCRVDVTEENERTCKDRPIKSRRGIKWRCSFTHHVFIFSLFLSFSSSSLQRLVKDGKAQFDKQVNHGCSWPYLGDYAHSSHIGSNCNTNHWNSSWRYDCKYPSQIVLWWSLRLTYLSSTMPNWIITLGVLPPPRPTAPSRSLTWRGTLNGLSIL